MDGDQKFIPIDQESTEKLKQSIITAFQEVSTIPLLAGDVVRFKIEIELQAASERPSVFMAANRKENAE